MASGLVHYTVQKCMILEEDWHQTPQFFVQIPDPERRKVFYKSRSTAGRENRRWGGVANEQMEQANSSYRDGSEAEGGNKTLSRRK